ncbi:MAG: S9 family peptidase, partial [Bacteroidota bacterium]
LELLDIFNLEYVSDPQISPDGQRVIYVRNFKDVMTDQNLSNLWMVNSDGSQNRPLTTGNQKDFAPLWSNDGQKIVYKSNRSGKVQLYLHWMDDHSEAALTNVVRSPGAVAWSDDDQMLAFNMFVPMENESIINMPDQPEGAVWNSPPRYIDRLNYRSDGAGYNESGYRQLFVLPVAGGTPRQVTKGENDHGTPTWSKDRRHLYFSANLAEDADYDPVNSEIYQVNIINGGMKTLTSRKGPDSNLALSPDRTKMAYTGFDDQKKGYQVERLYVANIDGSNPQLISGNFDRDVANIHWDASGEALFFQYDDEGKTKLAKMDLAGEVTDLSDQLGGLSLGRPYTAATFSVAKNGSYAFTFGGTQHPADRGIGQVGKNRRITRVNDDLFSYKQLGTVEEIWYKSSYDQQKIQGWIVKPPRFDPAKKYPLILEIHGGPFASYGSVFSAEVQLFAAAGYVVLYTNPRGSTSYGEAFGNMIDKNYPSQDYDDLISGVDAVIQKGYIDEQHLYVTGGSGGGVLTSWIIGKTDRFRAAVVAKPVINWYSWALYSDMPAYATQYWFSEMPWENPEAYMKRSPISLVANVKTPTMLLTGEEDFRTPMPESEQYYAALKLRKVDCSLVRIPGASHGIAARPSNLIAKVAAILAWFDRYRS